jgi:hypothetical protein
MFVVIVSRVAVRVRRDSATGGSTGSSTLASSPSYLFSCSTSSSLPSMMTGIGVTGTRPEGVGARARGVRGDRTTRPVEGDGEGARRLAAKRVKCGEDIMMKRKLCL